MHVIGTGALAMLYGSRLAAAGCRVTLFGSWREGVEAIASDGICRTPDERAGSAPVRAAYLEPHGQCPGEPARLVLVLVKSHQNSVVSTFAARSTAAGGVLLTLQNGLGIEAALRSAAGPRPVIRGVTTRAAHVLGPGRVADAGGGPTVLPTEPRWVGQLLESAGFTVRYASDIQREIWRKVAVSCAINPLTALAGVPNGALLERAEWRSAMIAAAREVGRVARAVGGGGWGDPGRLAADVARATAGNRSSMLQDLARGARTEIDALCGAVVATGRRVGVSAPVNEELWRRVRERERGLRLDGSRSPRRGRPEVSA